jgi:hypothetical protein
VNTVSAVKFVTVSNPKKNNAAVSITGVTALVEARFCLAPNGAPPCGFGIDSSRTTCRAGQSIAAGKSCKVAIVFSPIASGPWNGILQITGNMSNPGSISLSGAGR